MHTFEDADSLPASIKSLSDGDDSCLPSSILLLIDEGFKHGFCGNTGGGGFGGVDLSFGFKIVSCSVCP